MSENSNTSNVQLPGLINNILGPWADDIIDRVNESARFLGVTTTEITDGSTVSTIVIDSESVSVSTGDIAVYSGNYFLFYSSAWHAGGGGGGPSSIDAEDVSYDNTTSGLTATDVQAATDEIVSDLSDKMDKVNPTGSGSFSLNRRAGTTIGTNSVAVGYNTTASGLYSLAEGIGTIASGTYSHAEGNGALASGANSHAEGAGVAASGRCAHAEGNGTQASGDYAHTEGNGVTASGDYSHAEGDHTIAAGSAQHVSGKYNIADNADTYAEIVGNGTATNARSNARTLDWQGNETIAGDLTFNGSTSLSDTLDDKTTYIECTQAQYDAWEQAGTLESDVTYYIADANNPNVATASQVMYDNSDSGLEATNVQGAIDEVNNAIKLQSEIFTLTFSSTITDLYISYQNCYYCPITEEVHIAFAIYSASGKIPVAGNVFATIPENYRPTETRNTGYAVVIPSSSGQYAPHIEAINAVGTNGELSLRNWIWGSTTTQILIVDFSYIR